MNDNNNTQGTASGTPQRSDVGLPPSVNTRRRTPAKIPYKRNSKAESPLNEESSSNTSVDSDGTVVADNTTPVKTVGDDAPPKDGVAAPPDDGDGDVTPPEDRDGDGYESPPKQPTYDMDTFMFHASPLGSHSYTDWTEYFNKVWDAQLTRSTYLKDYISG